LTLAPVKDLLARAIHDRAFPGAALITTHRGAIVIEEYAGRFTYDHDSAAVDPETVYDLASLTKAIATTPIAMLLYERGILKLDQPVVDILPEFRSDDPRREGVTVAHLLTHTSGLPAHRKYYEHAKDRNQVLDAVFHTKLEADPGAVTVYSDIGFILLGLILERLTSSALNVLFEREIASKLGLSIRFGPLDHVKHVPPTIEAVDFRGRRVYGQVNDENAWVMGGIAGHAGLFGTAQDVSKFALCMLEGGTLLFSPQTVALFTTPQPGTSRTLGWDTPTQPSQSGRHFSPATYGHLGYTGTSLWIDPTRNISITLLTNRTYPDNRSQEIKRFRPLIHDAVMESLIHE
jgi:CubicO group peptidase (beta-lactamase class C family)